MAATKSAAPARVKDPSSAPNAPDRAATSRSADDDIVLNEAVKILTDYVDLLNGGTTPRSRVTPCPPCSPPAPVQTGVAGAMPSGDEGGAVDAGRFRRVSDSDLSPL